MPIILKTEEEKKETKRKNYLNRKSPDYVKKPQLTDEEKKIVKSEYNKRLDVTIKRVNIYNQQYFCLGCQRNYGYTHKRDHYTGFKHKHYMKLLKDRNSDHVEQHLHDESNKCICK